MQRRGANPVTGSLLFLLLLFIWLVAGLTLLGPYVGAVFTSAVYSVPTRSMGFTCPILVDRQVTIRATIPNLDEQEQTFDATFIGSTYSTQYTPLCQSEVVILPHDSEAVTCTFNPVQSLGEVRNLIVTARARGESFCGSNMYPCVNSSHWGCYIATFTENLLGFFGNSLLGLLLLRLSRFLLRRVHRSIRRVLILLWLLAWLWLALLAYWLTPDYRFVIPFLIPSAVLLVGWLLRLYPRVLRMVARQP